MLVMIKHRKRARCDVSCVQSQYSGDEEGVVSDQSGLATQGDPDSKKPPKQKEQYYYKRK